MLGFKPLGMLATVRLNFASDFLITEKRKRVSVQIFEACGDGAPGLYLRRMVEPDAALAPRLKLGKDVFSQEDDLRGAADEFVFFGLAFGSNQCQDCAAIWRRDPSPNSV